MLGKGKPWNKLLVRAMGWTILLGVIFSLISDVLIAIYVDVALRRPKNEADWYDTGYAIGDVTWVLENRDEVNPTISYTFDDLTEEMVFAAIRPDCTWVEGRYDTMDFRMVRLYRFMRAGEDVLDDISPSGALRKRMESVFLNMKFWITEPGEDSVCYYSENHQITYFVLAYLVGRMYPYHVFTNDGRTGAVKAAEARERIITWLDLRGKYGFSEFYSHNYLPIDFSELSLLLLYGDRGDDVLMKKTTAVLDILALDYALAYRNGTIIGAQGRAYVRNNMNTARADINSELVIDAIWGDYAVSKGRYYHGNDQAANYIKLLTTTDENGEPLYTVPDVIRKIGEDASTEVIKTSFGLMLSDYEKEGLKSGSEKALLMQLGSGALSNPEIISSTIDFARKYKLWHNDFLTGLRYCNITLIRWSGLLPALSESLNIYTNGMAQERANIYAYRTSDYKLSTLVDYFPGRAGAQQTTMAAVLPGGVTIYTNHPLNEDRTTSPGYWAGYGVAPHAAQYENVSMMIHKVPRHIPLAPNPMPKYTHTYLPEELLDEVVVTGRYAFARKGNVFLALIGNGNFSYRAAGAATVNITEGVLTDKDLRADLVQYGRSQFTCYELSTLEDEGSFEAFMARVKGNPCSYNGKTLTYVTRDKTINLTYNGSFYVNNVKQATKYKRYDCSFASADYLSEEITVTYGGKNYRINVKQNTPLTQK